MGSYKDVGDWLPFMTRQDYEEEDQVVKKLFEHLRGKTRNTGLLGIPFYVAMMHTADGVKVLEINSRPGDPEILNLLPILKNDLVDICYSILDGNLTRVEFEPEATVVTYKVPPTYGGKEKEYLGDRHVDLSGVDTLSGKFKRHMKVYPGSLELRGNEAYALNSRAICTVGIGDSIEEARKISLEGLDAIKGGNLWNRTDIASLEHINGSIKHMRSLRAAG
jgi:phosphoribosylamine--glycine ligase